jgi:hypothetical protein
VYKRQDEPYHRAPRELDRYLLCNAVQDVIITDSGSAVPFSSNVERVR